MKYGPEVIAALTVCWTVLGMPAGKRLAPMLGELVAVLRHFRELVIGDDTAALLVSMSAATIDRRLAGERAKYRSGDGCGTKPGSLLKGQIPVRTWAEWDDARPGFVEIDTVFHDGGNRGGGHAFTLTVTDIATGWTESRSLPDKDRQKHTGRPQSTSPPRCRSRSWAWTPTTDRNSSTTTYWHGAEGPPHHLHPVTAGQQERRLSRRAEELGGGAHSGRLPPLRHRSRTVATQRNLASAVEADQLLLPPAETDIQSPHGAKVSRKHDKATTPFHRAIDHPSHDRGTHRRADRGPTRWINPAATQRQIQALTAPALHPDHQQSQPAPRSNHQARTFT